MSRHPIWVLRTSLALTLTTILLLSNPVQAAERPDAWITTKTKIALLTSRGLTAPTNIHVDTIDGRVTLYGTVKSPTEAARAEQVAKSVQGAREVRNLLQVVPTQSQAEVRLSDDQVKQRVSDALNHDKALAETTIHVKSVNAGVVLLAGKAGSISEHLRAIQTAIRVPGVRGVATEIQSPQTMADAEIWRDGQYDPTIYEHSAAHDTWVTTAIKLRLLANSQTPVFDINVDSDDGIVTLFGIVDSERTSLAAESEARKVRGVRDVKNALQVVPTSQQQTVARSDADVKAALQERIQQRRDLADDKIEVDVKNGVARLSGRVKTPTDRLVAMVVARTTAGVRGLVDELRIEEQEVSVR